jgi:hypothetical protein
MGTSNLLIKVLEKTHMSPLKDLLMQLLKICKKNDFNLDLFLYNLLF